MDSFFDKKGKPDNRVAGAKTPPKPVKMRALQDKIDKKKADRKKADKKKADPKKADSKQIRRWA